MPKQGFGTNDCGVWMCCVASIYAKSVFSRAIPSQPQETVVPFQNAILSLVRQEEKMSLVWQEKSRSSV
jgi:hypothetical protein